MASFNAAHGAARDSAARQRQHSELLGLNAYERHKRFVHDLTTYYGGTLPSSDNLESLVNGQQQQQQQQQQPNAAGGFHVATSKNVLKSKIVKTDEDTLRESYRFIRTSEDDADEDSWSVRLAKKYYSRLFREYCIADFSRYKEGKMLGLRWRTQREVISGKGQFSCGTRGCEERRGLASFEVPFGYVEAEQKKQALVKVRLCPQHAYQLNCKKNKEAEKRQDTMIKKSKKKKKRKKEIETSSTSGDDSDAEEEEKEHLTHRKKVRASDDGLEDVFTGLFE